MFDLVGEVEAIASLHQLHHCIGAVVRGQVEVTGDFVEADVPFQLAAFFGVKLLLGLLEDNIRVALRLSLFQSVDDTLDLTILVE